MVNERDEFRRGADYVLTRVREYRERIRSAENEEDRRFWEGQLDSYLALDD